MCCCCVKNIRLILAVKSEKNYHVSINTDCFQGWEYPNVINPNYLDFTGCPTFQHWFLKLNLRLKLVVTHKTYICIILSKNAFFNINNIIYVRTINN